MDNLYCTLGFAKWNRNQAYLQEKLVFFVEVLVFSTEFVHSWLRNSYYEILESARRHTKSKHCYILTFRGVEFSYVISLEQEKSASFEYHLNKKKRCYLKYAWWYFHSHFHVTWWNVHKKIWCAHHKDGSVLAFLILRTLYYTVMSDRT